MRVSINYGQSFIMDYNNPYGRRFDLLTCILVVYDSVMAPINLSFGLSMFDDVTLNILLAIDVSIKFVFFLDIVLSFRRGYMN